MERLRVVIVEDVEVDAELAARELRRAGIVCDVRRVATADQYESALKDFQPHVILSDFSMPGFDGMEALAIARRLAPDIPFVFVSGTLGEEYAIRALKNGASDYVLKTNLVRLPAAVERAIEQARERGARQALERDLQESERRYRKLFEGNPHPMWVYDTETLRFLAVNDRAVAFYGYSREEFLSMTIKDIRPIKDVDRLMALVERGVQKVSESGPWRHRKKNGELIDVEVTSHAFGFEGRPARLVVAYDITARKRVEERLLESESKYRGLIEQASDGIYALDQEGRFVLANSRACELLGYSESELLGLNQKVTYLEDDLDSPTSRIRAVQSGAVLRYERTVRRKDGSTFPAEISSRLLTNGTVQVIFNDITERKRNEAALRESEYRLDLALEASELAVWEWNLATGGVLFSRHWWPILGYKPDEVPFRIEAWENLTQPDDLVRVRSMLAALVKGSIPVLDIEYRMRAKNGEWRWIRSVGRVVERNAAGLAVRLTGTHGDVTERKAAEQQLRDSEAKYRGLIEQASDGILLTDLEGNFVMANARACELLRCAQSDLLQMRGSDTYLAEDAESHAERKKRVRAGEDLRYERMVRRKDGTAFPAEVSIKMLDNRLIQVIFHDITNRRAQEQKIARLSRIQAVLSGINSAIVRIRNRQELFHEACRIIVERGGFTVGWIGVLDQSSGKLAPVAQAGLPIDLGSGGESSVALTPAGVAEVALREGQPAFDNRMDDSDSVNAGQDTKRVREAAIRSGARSVIVLPLFVEGKTFGVLTLYASEQDFFDDEEIKLLRELAGDISFGLEFIAKEEKVDYLAYYDALTGLPNRALFFDRLGQQLGAARRERLNVALLLLDLDRFRMINDTLGRQAGDALLKELGQRVRSVIRDQDTVARLGPDSFAVAASGRWQMADLAHVLDARNEAIFGRPFLLGEEELRVSATAGIAMFPGDGGDPESLFTNAEAALREAKEQSVPFLFYSPEMNARVSESLRLENRLRRALERSEMVLWYQPKVSGKTRRVTGLEALIRWNDPETGMVPPARFIPLMEQTGLILDAGHWVMSQVARDCAQWTAKGLKVPRVAVNVSSIQLRQSDFVEMVVEAARKTQEAGGALDLEITESVFMENLEDTTRKLQIVRGLGVNIAVDDFGTGYSSLAYIARLPIHELKVDRSFVVGMTEQQESLAIVKAIISLAHSLKLQVVAEGVETDEQAEQLEQLGCDYLQGYLFGRPAPSEEVSRLQ